jgi:hypothetical protein
MKMMFAYVDPGLGLLAWQALVAVFLGLVFYVRKTREKVLGWLQSLFRRKKVPQAAPMQIPPPGDELPR